MQKLKNRGYIFSSNLPDYLKATLKTSNFLAKLYLDE